MKIDRIQYKKIFPLGSYTTEHIGLEASLDENENPEEALQRLIIIANELHSDTIATLEEYRGTAVRTIEPKEPETKLSKEEKQKAEIASCTDKTVLESYRLIVKKYPNLQETYDNTMEKIIKNA